ncbi:Integral membrane protein [Armadillidium nasatum]|uniref:Integral membrane protein n=1 Tax=Armadillidium nasatum TaxID=96803 RepID=A0A5N5T4Q2_9CRUS|nr:Integral membrane protein [Armadillidium nasatum]
MKYFYNSFNIIILILSFLNKSGALHTTGVWKSKDEFFHFITKFGFQKTNQHELEASEGYIFGNITSLLKSNSHSQIYGTLALLPRQFFVPFYKNRSLSLFENADIACQSMFKNIDSESYDAQCHDTGREDFLRKVPCPVGKLCVDEDNPNNVIKGMQLTYTVQDINNPRFWYLSFVACRRNKSCIWEYVKEPLEVKYDLNIVNGRPFIPRTNPFEYHFSFDQQDTVEIYVFCLLYYGCILIPLQLYAVFKQVHPITRLFTATLLAQLAGLILDSLHLLIFSYNGVGVNALNIMGDLFNIVAQSFFMILLLLLAKGWAITRMNLARPYLLILLWLAYTILLLILYFWNKTEVDVIEDIDEFQTWPGWLTLSLRVVIMFWFLYELRNTMKFEHNEAKLQFFLQFGAATLVWFVYMPVVALIALEIATLWRYKIILGFTYCADLLAHSFMAYMLWPNRSEQYLLLAEDVDFSEELEAFDEAPHIVNHHEESIHFLSAEEEVGSLEFSGINI